MDQAGYTEMKIYYAPNTRAVRIVWLFEELGLPYELERFKLGDAAMRTDALLKVHPLGRVPALEDGGTVIFSRARSFSTCWRSTEKAASSLRFPLPSFRPICNGCIMRRA